MKLGSMRDLTFTDFVFACVVFSLLSITIAGFLMYHYNARFRTMIAAQIEAMEAR